ncbi:keratin-associated protein 5-4-like [Drosophila takahashii]|uniref:keratin-associated protein 5-4-like n=1 Tax=Drosophila takahashii TaxID=29030 RepID=UPI0038995EB9
MATRTHRLPPLRRAITTSGSSIIPAGHSSWAISCHSPLVGADTCRINMGRFAAVVVTGSECWRSSLGLPLATGSGQTQGPFSSGPSRSVATSAGVGGPVLGVGGGGGPVLGVSGVGGPVLGVGGVQTSGLPLLRGSRGLPCGASSQMRVSAGGSLSSAGPSGQVQMTVCCRQRTPSVTNCRMLLLTWAAGMSVRTNVASSDGWRGGSGCGCCCCVSGCGCCCCGSGWCFCCCGSGWCCCCCGSGCGCCCCGSGCGCGCCCWCGSSS